MTATPLPQRLPIYYGWVVVAIAFITMAVAVNARTSFSLLYSPILDEFGWTRATTAAAFSIGFVASIAMTPVLGVLMDRWGPRLVVPLSAVVAAAGFGLATFTQTPLVLYLTLGVLVVGGSVGMSYVGHSMFLPNWFVRRRGLAIGIAFSGVGLGSIVLLPALQAYIDTAGWRAACVATGIALLVVVVPLNLFVQRWRPQDIGLEPDGDGRPGAPDRGPAPDIIVDRAWTAIDWTLPLALRTARFWWIFAGYFAALYVWYSIQVHQTRFLIDMDFAAAEAAFALGLVPLFGIVGQIGIGAWSDRIGREWGWTLALSGFVVASLALVVLVDYPARWLVYLMVGAQGLLGYGVASLYGAITAEIFAGRRFATIFAVTSVGANLGAGVGPWVTGYVYDVGGSYVPAFWLFVAMSIVSILCIWIAAPRRIRLVAGQAAKRG